MQNDSIMFRSKTEKKTAVSKVKSEFTCFQLNEPICKASKLQQNQFIEMTAERLMFAVFF